MRDDEPLENWLFWVQLSTQRKPDLEPQDESRKILDQLDEILAPLAGSKVNYGRVRAGLLGRYNTRSLSVDETEDAQRLFLQVWERGGTGANYVLEGLLEGIALAMQMTSIPFWKQLLDLSRPREQSTTKRRTYALAALALLAIIKDEPAAYVALAEALTHSHEQVRAIAAFYIGKAYALSNQPTPAPIEAALVDIATSDRTFVSRFQARQALRLLSHSAPRDNPDNVYFLKVQLRGDKATRTIAVVAENTLSDLHYAIQHAFGWDADHLYSFFMHGGRDDQRYAIHCPELDASGNFDLWSMPIIDIEDDIIRIQQPSGQDVSSVDGDENGELYTTTTLIGTLGLVPKHSFIYFFDYGDSHEFNITVIGIEPQFDDSGYPRIVESKGKAPIQYYTYEDEKESEDEEW